MPWLLPGSSCWGRAADKLRVWLCCAAAFVRPRVPPAGVPSPAAVSSVCPNVFPNLQCLLGRWQLKELTVNGVDGCFSPAFWSSFWNWNVFQYSVFDISALLSTALLFLGCAGPVLGTLLFFFSSFYYLRSLFSLLVLLAIGFSLLPYR